MMQEDNDKIIKIIQSSTRKIMGSFRERIELLRDCSDDVKSLIREGYDTKTAQNTAERLFGAKENISFLAIDGTQSQDQTLDMLVFYAGAFGYIGQLEFTGDKGCTYGEPIGIKGTMGVSTAIPVYALLCSNFLLNIHLHPSPDELSVSTLSNFRCGKKKSKNFFKGL
jgi:hypothetical protein